MPNSRPAYRVRQFWSALIHPHARIAAGTLVKHLSPVQIVLFQRMQSSEQVHAWRVLERLQAGGHQDPDLLAAALLHDVGKILHPITLFERVIIVLGQALFPAGARRWSEGTPTGLRRPFVVAAHHAEWGAHLAGKAGASARTVELIRLHQDHSTGDDPLLQALQLADNSN